MRKAAIILCGGKSSRMGRDKATLPFGPEQMLQRVVRLLGQVVDLDRMIVVAARSQSLPDLPAKVAVVRDIADFRGPLQGLVTGLAALDGRADAAYVTACDVPLLVPAFVQQMFERLGDDEIAVPFDGQYHHPLAAVYRTTVLEAAQRLIDSQRMRPRYLFDEVRCREIPVDEMRAVDPQLATLQNLNHEADYRTALAAASIAEPLKK